MRVGAVDIGTNSMRLLIMDGVTEVARRVVVTGLGRGVDASGALAADAIERSIAALTEFGRLMDRERVDRRAAIATSATRDAENRESFMDEAEVALGVRPSVISGEREGRLAFSGATAGLKEPEQYLVVDIGGGSTEFVTATGSESVDIGSVRLTDRVLPTRPASSDAVTEACVHVEGLISGVEADGLSLVGVAGTWTSLAAMASGLGRYDREKVHGYRLSHSVVESLMWDLSQKTVAETAAIPELDPARASVILAGAIVALMVMERRGRVDAIISERDTLDGLAAELIGLR